MSNHGIPLHCQDDSGELERMFDHVTVVGPCQHCQQRRSRSRGLLVFALCQSFLILMLIGITRDLMRSQAKQSSFRSGFRPAEDALRYQSQMFEKYAYLTSATAQEPGPELDHAWHRLLSGMMFRISGEELAAHQPVQTIALADGSGFVASLGVYHELHCIKLLKHWLHKDHYLENTPEPQVEQYWKHLNHCLDWLKGAALCRSDTTLTTLAWNGTRLDSEYPIAYQCVEPSSVLTWAESRAVDVTRPGVLATDSA